MQCGREAYRLFLLVYPFHFTEMDTINDEQVLFGLMNVFGIVGVCTFLTLKKILFCTQIA
ncbi:hypothetical protein NRIC_12330 [Enterococcus florum]|uniref:Uncharacterized protein n=1 Tax=Enterococcus florum TaxID=2480627 RepID=A0A4P5PCX2_9ENTE|nr:hypothetical protein NRIC_12330 [Enterococcus florum]